MMRRVAIFWAYITVGMLLTACTSTQIRTEPPVRQPGTGHTNSTTQVSSTPPEPIELTADDLQEWIADGEWSFADNGLLEPVMITFAEGKGTDEFARTYEIGVGVDADVNGDGIVDLAVPVSRIDGNGFMELWYIWLGQEAGTDAVAEQVIYPIARTTSCGDAVHSITPAQGGFAVEQTLRMPADTDRDCASGGTGYQIREIKVTDIDGVPYPIQTAPTPAWGGICPRSDRLGGFPDTAPADGRAAPPAAAPRIFDDGEQLGIYELPTAPLFGDGTYFFGFQRIEAAPTVDTFMYCAFSG